MQCLINEHSTVLSDYYDMYHNELKRIKDNFDIRQIRQYINYSDIMDIMRCKNYKKYRLKSVLSKVYSIRYQKSHRVFCFAGLKIKMKCVH